MRNSLVILGILEDQDIEWFTRIGQKTVLSTDDILIEEGNPIESIWFVLEGSLSVTTIKDTSIKLATTYPGEIVGEVSFLDSRPPSVTLIAAERTTLLEITRKELQIKLQNDFSFASRFYRAIGVCVAQRLIHLTQTTLTISTLGVVDKDTEQEEQDTGTVLDPDVLESMSLASRRFEYLVERATKN